MSPPRPAPSNRVEVLIAEDSPTQREELRFLLARNGYRVTSTSNGEEALEAARDRRPDLLLADILMPRMNGYELCKAIKSDDRLKDVPVLLLTSLSSHTDVTKALECGADNFIRKPYVEEYLLSRIRTSLMDRQPGGIEGAPRNAGSAVGEKGLIYEQKQVLDFLFSTFEEVVQMNENLERAVAQLEIEKEMASQQAHVVNAVLNAEPDAIGLVNLGGDLLVANSAAGGLAELHGVTIRELANPAMAPVIAEQTTEPAEFLAEAEANQAGAERESVYEYQLTGSGRWFRRYSAPVQGDSGKLLGHIFVLRETTVENEAERLKEDLMATVSHELRTPLTGILGYAELLSSREYDTETQRRYLGMIHSQAVRLTALVTDFLDLQRIEEGSFTLALEPFDLRELVREEVELYSGQSEAHAIELAEAHGPLVVVGERARIAQVTANLLSNAIKYSPAGGTVRVRVESRDGAVRVAVSDEGVGIPRDQQGRMFEKFFRVDTTDTREIGGTGLGLALCREIVEAHGGRIDFESTEGEGSTFWFELPTGERQRTAAAYALVVENDLAAATFVAECLREEGYAAEIVGTGEEAVRRARRDRVALICLDTRLAGELDGWQVLLELKGDARTAGIPVVVCSGSPGSFPQRAAALGAADFLRKPFSAEQLLGAIHRVVQDERASVLVVDDEQPVRALVLDTLGKEGFDLREASDGEEALAAVAEERPDAIVLDLMMPGLDGFAVIDRLQSDPDTRSIPIVVLTARSLSADERRFLQEQTLSLLSKSNYSAADLRRLIRQAVGSGGP